MANIVHTCLATVLLSGSGPQNPIKHTNFGPDCHAETIVDHLPAHGFPSQRLPRELVGTVTDRERDCARGVRRVVGGVRTAWTAKDLVTMVIRCGDVPVERLAKHRRARHRSGRRRIMPR